MFPRQSHLRSGTTRLNISQGLVTKRKLYLSEVFSQSEQKNYKIHEHIRKINSQLLWTYSHR